MSNKVIALVGVTDVFGSTNVFQAKAFMNRGYKVIPVNYRTLIKRYGRRNAQAIIYEIALRQRPALMLFSKFNGMDSVVIGKCGQHTKTWLWFMDGLNTLRRIPEMQGHAQMAEFVSATGRGVCKELSKTRADVVYQIMEGIDPEFYYPVRGMVMHDADVSFIGSANAERIHYINLLKEQGYNVKAYGSGFENGEVHGGLFNAVCGGSKVMLALSIEHDTEDYFSDRIFRYGACGSFVIHKHSPAMDKRFVHGEDLWYFKTDEELLSAVKAAMDETEQRKQMAENLRNKVLSNHTWYHVVDEIIKIAGI